MKFTPIIIFIFLFPTLLLSQPEARCPYNGPQLPAIMPASTVGDFTITTTDGITRNLYDALDSGKTVFIDLFYTTCYYCQLHAPVIEQIYQNTGAGSNDIEFWGISNNLFDTNYLIDLYKQQYNITNPCAGPWGGGTTAFTTVVAGQNFSGFPTYCVVCPDRTMFFAPIYPPTVTGFDPYFEICASMVGTEEPGLNPDNRGKYTISPNPAGRELTISTDPEIQGITGSIVHHSVHYLNKGDAQLKIPVREIPAGAYGVLITQNGQPPVHLKVIINR
jgi:hypothetical protein